MKFLSTVQNKRHDALVYAVYAPASQEQLSKVIIPVLTDYLDTETCISVVSLQQALEKADLHYEDAIYSIVVTARSVVVKVGFSITPTHGLEFTASQLFKDRLQKIES